MLRPRLLVLALLALLMTALVACGEDSPADGEEATDSGPSAAAPTDATEAPTEAPTATPTEAPTEAATPTAEAGSSGETPAAIVQALQGTLNAESYEFEMTIRMEDVPDFPGGTMGFGADGAVDPGNQRMRMRMDLSSIFDAAAESGDASAEELQMMEAFFGDGVMEFIIADGVTYLRFPLFAALTGANTEWVSMELSDEDDPFALGAASGLGVPQFASPEELIESLGELSDVREAGSETVRGVQTTRYDAMIDLEASLAALSADERAEVEAELQAAGLDELPPMPVSVWIGDDGLLRKVSMTLDFSAIAGSDFAAEQGFVGEMSVDFEYFGFGEDIEIDLPPDNEVTPIDGLGFGLQ